MRGPLNKVGLADRPPHPKFAERISTSPRKRGEVSHTVASIQFKAIMLSSWNRIGKIKERRQRCLRFRLTVATGKSNRWIFSKCLSSGFSRIRLVMASTSGFSRRCDQPAVHVDRVARARDTEQAPVAIGRSFDP